MWLLRRSALRLCESLLLSEWEKCTPPSTLLDATRLKLPGSGPEASEQVRCAVDCTLYVLSLVKSQGIRWRKWAPYMGALSANGWAWSTASPLPAAGAMQAGLAAAVCATPMGTMGCTTLVWSNTQKATVSQKKLDMTLNHPKCCRFLLTYKRPSTFELCSKQSCVSCSFFILFKETL